MREVARILIAATVAAAAAALAAPPADGGAAQPRVFTLADSTQFRWVPERLAIRHGEIDESQFTSWELRELSSLLDRSLGVEGKGANSASVPAGDPHECASISYTFGSEGKALDISTLYSNSSVVVEGQITAAEEGFLNGSPATLFMVRIEAVHSGGESLTSSTFYFAYAEADVHIRGLRICQRTRAFPKSPRVGSSVAIFANVVASDDAPLLVVTEEDVLFETPAGRVGFSNAMKGTEGFELSWGELSDRLADLSRRSTSGSLR